MAARLELLENVGDFVEYSNLGKSVIVVRAKDGIKAYHNACRHRGVPLAGKGEAGNCAGKGFICPFHGWRWNTEGENTFVYGAHMFSRPNSWTRPKSRCAPAGWRPPSAAPSSISMMMRCPCATMMGPQLEALESARDRQSALRMVGGD